MANKKAQIYTTPTCTYCKAAKEFFNKNNITYEEFNVAEDAEKRQEMIEKSGQMGVPVITVSDPDDFDAEPQMIIGFDEGKLKEVLGI